jgi:hypothetical protein
MIFSSKRAIILIVKFNRRKFLLIAGSLPFIQSASKAGPPFHDAQKPKSSKPKCNQS